MSKHSANRNLFFLKLSEKFLKMRRLHHRRGSESPAIRRDCGPSFSTVSPTRRNSSGLFTQFPRKKLRSNLEFLFPFLQIFPKTLRPG